jgi:hypothetical protein
MKIKLIGRLSGIALATVLSGGWSAAQETNMHLRLVPLDDMFNPISEVFVDVTQATNIVNIGAFVRGGSGISSTKIVNKYQIRYADPDLVSSNYIIRTATSYAFITNPGPYAGVFEGFDPQSSYNGNDTKATNAYLNVFATDTANNGFSYGEHPADFTNDLGRLVLAWGVEFTTNVTAGVSTNLGVVTTRTWTDEAAKIRTMVWDPTTSYTITFVPEPSAWTLIVDRRYGPLAHPTTTEVNRRTCPSASLDPLAGYLIRRPRFSSLYQSA